jgi:hypothetical protein
MLITETLLALKSLLSHFDNLLLREDVAVLPSAAPEQN